MYTNDVMLVVDRDDAAISGLISLQAPSATMNTHACSRSDGWLNLCSYPLASVDRQKFPSLPKISVSSVTT
jgi:hypothetical protein